MADFLLPDKFYEFSYSKKNHMKLFSENDYDLMLFGEKVNPEYCDLKVYQDLLTFSFIIQNIKTESKILEVGGGESRILEYFKNDYECWNLDKFEGKGNGPLDFQSKEIKIVCDYAGNFNSELKDEYFDFVFSISALEHTEINNFATYKNILQDMNRVLKPRGFSLHTIDQCAEDISFYDDVSDLIVWTNPVIEYFAENQNTISKFTPVLEIMKDQQLFGMSEKYYIEKWQIVTGKSYQEFGMPFSYNFLWRKSEE